MSGLTHQYKLCPECGSDPFKSQDWDKMHKEMEELVFRYKRARSSWAELSAADEIQILKLEEGMRWLQRKVKKQAQAIQKLENKLKQRGEQPYKENNE